MSFRNFVITDFETHRIDYYRSLNPEIVRYLCGQIETTPLTGKDHLQIYFESHKKIRFSAVKKLFGSKTIHVEARKGTATQARDYSLKTAETLKKYPKWRDHGIRKTGTQPFEIGTWNEDLGSSGKQGQRTDLEMVYEMIQQGKTEFEIMETYPVIFLKFCKRIRMVRNMYLQRTAAHWRPVTTTVLYGRTRTGKTSYVYKKHDPKDVFMLPSLDPVWFDSYSGQSVIIIDDFYGQIKPGKLLKLLDNYNKQWPVKGGFVTPQWSHVYITSNEPPENWYHSVPDEVLLALSERLTQIIYFPPVLKKVYTPLGLRKIHTYNRETEEVGGSSITPHLRDNGTDVRVPTPAEKTKKYDVALYHDTTPLWSCEGSPVPPEIRRIFEVTSQAGTAAALEH